MDKIHYIKMRAMFTIVNQTPLYKKPSLSSDKYCDIPDGMIVHYNGEENFKGSLFTWTEIMYKTNLTTFIGWIPSHLLEPFTPSLEGYDIIKIKFPTQSESDFAQNFKLNGTLQFNACGQFSVLFCAGWYDATIEEWLDVWKLKAPKVYNRIFQGGKGRTTGIPDLISMLSTFDGYTEKFQLISEKFKYPDGRILFTPYKSMEALRDNRLIIGCKIESRFGRLRPAGIPHWVVMERVIPEGRGGTVKIYNPASNSIETYQWEDFLASTTKNPFGLVVPR